MLTVACVAVKRRDEVAEMEWAMAVVNVDECAGELSGWIATVLATGVPLWLLLASYGSCRTPAITAITAVLAVPLAYALVSRNVSISRIAISASAVI